MAALIHARLDLEGRSGKILQVLIITLILNWSIALLKVVYGLSTRTMVMVADGIHSISDGLSNVVGIIAISIASHPADKRHPYGHRKFETIATLIISSSLFFTAITILKEALQRLMNPEVPVATVYSFGIVGVTLAVNLFTAVWERRKGKRMGSELLIADSWHTFSDIFVSLSVLAALIGIQMGYHRLDAVISMGIAAFIGYIAVHILIHSSDVLTDSAVLDDAEVRKTVMGVHGVLDCHEIRNRGRCDDISVDLHVLVDPQMTVEKSHELANLIEKDLKARIQGITEVLVHIEPSHHDHHGLEGNGHPHA